MTQAADISGRMIAIRSIFEDALQAANTQADNSLLLQYLDAVEPLFRSVAYEGASMSRALSDFADSNNTLSSWAAFTALVPDHAVQIYIGLGWALGQRQKPPASVMNLCPPIYQPRVLDGYGYYEGMFRHRSSIRDRVIPVVISGRQIHAFDQGLGRSLWYVVKGDTSKLTDLIHTFPDHRLADLWRGVGIAVTYVGGYDEGMLRNILDAAGDHRFQLSVGAALLTRSRFDAQTLVEEAEMACSAWCHLSASDAADIVSRTEPKTSFSSDNYIDWITEILTEIQKVY